MLAAAVLAAGSGCAVKAPQTWRLVEQGGSRILVPPGVASAQVARRTFTAAIAPGRARCPEANGIELKARGRRVRIRVERERLLKQPPAGVSRWAAGAEARGCIAPGEAGALAERIAGALPLDPSAAYQLLHASDLRTGYVDLGPENRLQVDSPILRPETPADAPLIESSRVAGGSAGSITVDLKASANLLGFETAWYAIRRREGRAGFTIEPISAERHVAGEVVPTEAPATNYFRFAPEAAFYRLFYKAEQDTMRILVVGAPTAAELDRPTEELERGSMACEKLAGMCVAIPRGVAANPDLIVRVNGREVAVPVRSTVRQAIAAAGERNPETVLARLAVRRLYAGRPAAVEFDPGARGILDLPLTGGEEIWWRP